MAPSTPAITACASTACASTVAAARSGPKPAKWKARRSVIAVNARWLVSHSSADSCAPPSVTVTVTPPENFSFADGAIVTDVTAAEALDAAAKQPGSRDAYTKAEMTYAVTELFERRDSSRILPMLRQDFILKIPATLPCGGEFTGPEAFANFFTGTPGGAQVWESFDVHVDQVIESPEYLVAQLTNTAVLKATGKTVVLQNAWIFEAAGGRLTSAQLYADTAAASSAG